VSEGFGLEGLGKAMRFVFGEGRGCRELGRARNGDAVGRQRVGDGTRPTEFGNCIRD
jgi:hypothetical protein